MRVNVNGGAFTPLLRGADYCRIRGSNEAKGNVERHSRARSQLLEHDDVRTGVKGCNSILDRLASITTIHPIDVPRNTMYVVSHGETNGCRPSLSLKLVRVVEDLALRTIGQFHNTSQTLHTFQAVRIHAKRETRIPSEKHTFQA